ncbi:MAG: hypothetical protein WC876_04535 [Candidatus Thermoplasmatota archaeon]|jgi:hypothetical protein
MVNASVPFFALLVILVGMLAWYASFYGDDVVEDKFAGIEEPTGFLSFLEFISDTAVAVAQTAWALMSFAGSDLPPALLFPLRIIFGFVFALVIVAALAAFL